MKVTSATDVGNITAYDEFRRAVSPILDQVRTAINGGIQIENLRAKAVEVQVTVINSDVKVSHNLGIVPVGYFKIQGDSMTVFDAGISNWTTENIFVRASALGNCTILVVG